MKPYKNTQPVLTALVLIILPILLFISACEQKSSKDEEIVTGQFKSHEKTVIDSLKPREASPVDYGQIMETVFQLEDSVKRYPDAIDVRRSLVAAAYDTARRKVYTVGFGIPDTSTASSLLALKGAERAALVDAQRWAMFVMRWMQNPIEPAITDRVTGDVPPGVTVQKAVWPGNQVYLLVEFSM
ncbi:hypothetical protein JXJ21_15645 [candidate division KSB1 bacterium]|nr:hypothetical protein [candidate division KSB1 bacterium]